jgi:hypothetical protein
MGFGEYTEKSNRRDMSFLGFHLVNALELSFLGSQLVNALSHLCWLCVTRFAFPTEC